VIWRRVGRRERSQAKVRVCARVSWADVDAVAVAAAGCPVEGGPAQGVPGLLVRSRLRGSPRPQAMPPPVSCDDVALAS
jgi:hypothetical protein